MFSSSDAAIDGRAPPRFLDLPSASRFGYGGSAHRGVSAGIVLRRRARLAVAPCRVGPDTALEHPTAVVRVTWNAEERGGGVDYGGPGRKGRPMGGVQGALVNWQLLLR